MNLIITGVDSSLGAELYAQWKLSSTAVDRCYGIESRFMGHRLTIDREVQQAIEEMGDITHVINNWGINHLSWIGSTENKDEFILQANVMGPYWVVDVLAQSGQVCNVINVASATYRVSQRCTSLYSASKAALVQMTKVMSRELAPKGWTINCVAPGKMMDTLMSKLTDRQVLELRGWAEEDAEQYALGNVPMGRFTSTGEVAKAIYKMFEMPAYVNGSVLDVMGGA